MNKVTFKDIVGYKHEKKEAQKIVNLLSHYQELVAQGAYLPKGLIIYGEPGVGKTLFAKAIANEANVPFINPAIATVYRLDGTIEAFSKGLEEAKKKTPSILFLDEIDQLIGRRRNSDSDERHRLIDFLLQQMDGENSTDGVFIIATCNSITSLPAAFLRSGRMDLSIRIASPDYENRKELLAYYLSKNQCFKDIDIDTIAKDTDGLECADFKAITNSVLLECLMEKRTAVEEDFQRYFTMVRTKDLVREEKGPYSLELCMHELGHFAVGYHFGKKRGEINIREKTQGRTWFRREVNSTFETSLQNAMIGLGGKAAEEIYLQENSVGSTSDIEKTRYLIANLLGEGCYGFQYTMSLGEYTSEDLRHKREIKVSEIMDELYFKTKKIIYEEDDLVQYLKPILLKQGKITRDESEILIKKFEDQRKKQGKEVPPLVKDEDGTSDKPLDPKEEEMIEEMEEE